MYSLLTTTSLSTGKPSVPPDTQSTDTAANTATYQYICIYIRARIELQQVKKITDCFDSPLIVSVIFSSNIIYFLQVFSYV